MKLVVVSHKPCWLSKFSPSGYATDGGFPFQMRAISELFDSTVLLVPCLNEAAGAGETVLNGKCLSIVPLTFPPGSGIRRKIGLFFWLPRNSVRLLREIIRADAVHTPIPGDIGTVGMLLAFFLRKRLFIRYCGNWFKRDRWTEYFWRYFMERFSNNKRNITFATGAGFQPPSQKNNYINWIFATSLTEKQMCGLGQPRLLVSSEQPRLVIACRQEKDKGVDVLIRSLPLIAEDYPRVKLEVAGAGGELERFRELAYILKVEALVRFYGRLRHKRVLNLFKEANILCYPTMSSEGFPKVVLEALACGLPVITTRISSLPYLLRNSCGILLNEAAPWEVAQAVKKIFSDKVLYRKMSRKALEAAQNYTLERWTGQIRQALEAGWGDLSIS